MNMNYEFSNSIKLKYVNVIFPGFNNYTMVRQDNVLGFKKYNRRI